MATIIKSNKELTKRESYKLTMDPAIKKMKDFIGVQIEVTAYCLYKDVNKDGKEVDRIRGLVKRPELEDKVKTILE